MNTFDALLQEFKRSFEDKFFSKAERDALRQQLVAANLDARNRDVLRAKLFEIAKGGAGQDAQFAIDWLEGATRVLMDRVEQPSSSASDGSVVHFSPGDACLNAIIAQIASAKTTLDICVFTISDDRISDAIIARHRARVPVRILTDNEKLLDQGSDIDRLVQAGIAVRVDRTEAHMHHKFAVVDGKRVITGSYNWTRSAALYNEENIVLTSEAVVVKAYAKEFARMWEVMDEF